MAEKRDYYEVLGVQKNANADEIKKAYARLPFSITRTRIRATSRPRRSSRRQQKPTTCCRTPTSVPVTTSSAMPA